MVKARSGFQLTYLVLGVIVVVLTFSALQMLSKEAGDNANFTLTEVMEVVKNQGPIIFSHPTGSSLAGGSEVALAMGEQLDLWQFMRNAPQEIPSGGLVLYVNLTAELSLHFYPGKPEIAMVKQGDFQQYYTLPAGTYQRFEMMHMVKSYHLPAEIVNALISGEKTHEESVNDTPSVPYKQFSVGDSTYYLYEKVGTYYIEAPYRFIKRLNQTVYENALPFTDNTGTIDQSTDATNLAPYKGSIDETFKQIGVLDNGDKLLFQSSGFYNKLEKGEHILIETGTGIYILEEGLPGKPVISGNGKYIAYVDVLEFEAKGDVIIYHPETGTRSQITHYADANPPVPMTAKDVLWLDNENLLIIAGFDVGTVTQGGDVFLYSLKDLSLKLILKAEESEEVANMEWLGDQILMEIVYWTDANFNNYLYKEQLFTPENLFKGLD